MAADPQVMFNKKMLTLLQFNIAPGKRALSEAFAAKYIYDHRHDARLMKFISDNGYHDRLIEALLH